MPAGQLLDEGRAWLRRITSLQGQRLTLKQHREILILAGWVTAHHSVAVQLFAQEANPWARMGDRRRTEVALDKGRSLLDTLPYPENLDHHFVVDPVKFDFYAMDCYRTVGADAMAEHLAEEVIEANTDFDGQERALMRMAEARITPGVVRARAGDLEGAVSQGMRALEA